MASVQRASVTEDAIFSDLLARYAELGFRVFVLLGSDDETASWLSVSKSESRLEGYGYISLSASASLEVPGTIYISDPIANTAYARDAVWTLAYGIHNLIESWRAGVKGDEDITTLLASSSALLSELWPVEFSSVATGQDVVFSASAERQSELRVYSAIGNSTSIELGVWKAGATPALTMTGTVSAWPGGTTQQPLGDHGCPAGKYFSLADAACADCRAGTYRTGIDTTLYSCRDCEAGKKSNAGANQCEVRTSGCLRWDPNANSKINPTIPYLNFRYAVRASTRPSTGQKSAKSAHPAHFSRT